jgi:hypothetical protein
VARLLIAHGAEINAATTDDFTSLMFASQFGHLEVARLLIEHGANVNAATTNDGLTSLMLASMGGHLEVVRLLIKHGANENAKSVNGKTAIDIAEENGRENVVEFLRSRFLVKDVINRKGMEYKTRKALENAFEHHGHNFGMSRNVANPVSETILHSMGVGLSPTAATPFNTSAKERKRIAKQYENIGYGSQWKKMNTMKWVNNSRVGGSKNIRKTLRRKKTVRKTSKKHY